MAKPNAKQRKSLERATVKYQTTLTLADSFLKGKGVTPATAELLRLGVVDSPEPGHEQFVGRLAIPYIDKMGVYGLKFRCLVGHDCKAESCRKFLTLNGFETSLYNILDTDVLSDTIHITEGEPDAWILKQVFPNDGVVGIPGASNWLKHWPFHFAGFERVIMWPDGDKAGEDLAQRVRKDLRAVELAPVPKGMDVGEVYLAHGAEFLRAMIGEDEREDTD